MCIPMGFKSFMVTHPVSATMGLGYMAFAIIGVLGRNNATGRLILYTIDGINNDIRYSSILFNGMKQQHNQQINATQKDARLL